MGAVFENLTIKELCNLICGNADEEEEDGSENRVY